MIISGYSPYIDSFCLYDICSSTADKSPNAKLVHRRVEDIPDFNPEMAQALLTAESDPVVSSTCVDENECTDSTGTDNRSLSSDDMQVCLSFYHFILLVKKCGGTWIIKTWKIKKLGQLKLVVFVFTYYFIHLSDITQ